MTNKLVALVTGASSALDHELRTRGIRVSVIEPAYIKTRFEANNMTPDAKLGEYEIIRAHVTEVVRQAMANADAPEIVADVVIKAAQSTHPKLRYTAGKAAGQLQFLRRFAPASLLDKGVRKSLQIDANHLQ